MGTCSPQRRGFILAISSVLALVVTGCGTERSEPLRPAAGSGAGDAASVLDPELWGHEPTNVQFGNFALHVPANVNHVRGILLAIGGPNTQGFALGTPFGAPVPAVEASLQELGAMFRELAAERGLAILGSNRFGPMAYPNEPASDQLLLAGIAQAAILSGRPELMEAPLLLYGISGGGPEATGFTQRNPERVAALFLKNPLHAGPLTGRALSVPAYLILAELDVFVNNAELSATFEAHRSAGAPWALAMERGVPHHAQSPKQRELTVDWMRVILPRAAAEPFRANPPRVGWFGDSATGEIAPVPAFTGDLRTASWFPTQSLAVQWAAFIEA